MRNMVLTDDPYTLRRFLDAQDAVYGQVLAELRHGQKQSHWMWFVFPQIGGLGASAMARTYAIGSLDEARAYLASPILGARLLACVDLVQRVKGRSIEEILGRPDDLKYRSSLTLFAHATDDNQIFSDALAKYYGGSFDPLTVARLQEASRARMARRGGIVEILELTDGGYRFIEGVHQYSGGVRALDGYEIVRVRFHRPVPVAEGFRRIEMVLADANRPLTSFCACELRSPEPFSETGFRVFNDQYVETLDRWGIIRNGINPVARSNVCPEINGPPEPGFHAFAFTRRAEQPKPTFVISGSGEAPEGQSNYRDHIVRLGDTSAAGLADKARFVLSAMETRLAALGVGWEDTTDVHIYSVHDFHPLVGDIVGRGAGRSGMSWHFARPPVVDIEYEMDCRGVYSERVV